MVARSNRRTAILASGVPASPPSRNLLILISIPVLVHGWPCRKLPQIVTFECRKLSPACNPLILLSFRVTIFVPHCFGAWAGAGKRQPGIGDCEGLLVVASPPATGIFPHLRFASEMVEVVEKSGDYGEVIRGCFAGEWNADRFPPARGSGLTTRRQTGRILCRIN